MPPRPALGSADDWIRRARANLSLAKAYQAEGILLEDLCYQAQQAAEKALKAFYLKNGRGFPFVHTLDQLLSGLEDLGIAIPEDVDQASILTRYAVETRYPGTYEPVGEDEYRDAIRFAEVILSWVESY